MQKIAPMLWFDGQAEEAANFYVSVFRDSSIIKVSHYPAGAPQPEGSVMVVWFRINGQDFTALNGGPEFKFTEAVSFVIHCKDQEEIDSYWDTLSGSGGEESMCGWVKDKYGLSWQIVPEQLDKLIDSSDPARSKRVLDAVWSMRKIDLATMQRAYDATQTF